MCKPNQNNILIQDLRKTALSEMGDLIATSATITSNRGHEINWKVTNVYVKLTKNGPKNLAKKDGT